MTPEREISNLRALLTQTLEIKLKLFDAKVEAEKERDQLREKLAESEYALELRSKEIGQSVHRGNTVDYIYDKLIVYGNHIDCLREKLAVAVEALDWYADKKNWVLKLIKSTSGGRAEKLQYRGKIAKQALSKIREQREK